MIDAAAVTSRAFTVGKQRGVSLLEVIVSPVLVSTVGMALLGWVNTNLIGLSRVKAAEQRLQLTRTALKYMGLVNPMQQPQGQQRIGPVLIEWQATLLGEVSPGAGYPAGLGVYQVGLYDTRVQASSGDGVEAQLKLRLAGYQQVRQPGGL